MGGITTGIGLFSGIDTGTLINQLLAIEARPRLLAQQRIFGLQTQQAAFLDINSRLTSLRSAASSFRTDSTFGSMRATTSDDTVLTGSASSNAVAGSYSFIVDRLVSTQQLLSRGFADRDTNAAGATQFSFEPVEGRLDRDTALADLNGQDGISRGKIIIADDAGNSATIDLTKASTMSEVLDAINENGTVDVSASVEGGHLVLDYTGSGTGITVKSGVGYTTAASLGISTPAFAAQVTGNDIFYLVDDSPISLLNDRNGVSINEQISATNYDFTITVDGVSANVNLGSIYSDITEPADEGPVTTVGGVITRMNDALKAAGLGADVTAALNAEGTAIEITDAVGGRDIDVAENSSSTAADLGLPVGTTVQDTLTGNRILAGINSTLSKNLNGGIGIGGNGQVKLFDRTGAAFTVNLSNLNASMSEIMAELQTEITNQGGDITVSLNEEGTGLQLTDNSGGTGNFIVLAGVTSASLGISTGAVGVESDIVEGTNVQHQYILDRTKLSSMRGGRGVGTGTIEITDSLGATGSLTIDSNVKTLDDFIDKFNNLNLRAQARVNANGDGIEIYEDIPGGGSAGTVEISIRDSSGSVAKNLNIAGTAEGTDADNVIDGSFEKLVEFDTDATLDDVAQAINDAGVGVAASVISDGTGAKPYRLNLTSKTTGTAGRFILDTHGFNLGASTLDEGTDARVFFGGTDPATAVLLTSSTNTIDKIIQGVTIDLRNASDDPVTLSVTRNTEQIESKVNAFIDEFNQAISRIDFQTRFDPETEVRGPLLGDGTLLNLRAALYNTVQSEVDGISGTYTRLTQVGVKIGEGGRLTFDKDAFREALENDPDSVEAIFAEYELQEREPEEVAPGVFVNNTDGPDEFESLGVLGQIEVLMKTYTDSIDGVLTNRSEGLTSQITLQQTRIEDFTAKLEIRRQVLESRFLAMEQAIAQLQVQQTSLSQISLVG